MKRYKHYSFDLWMTLIRSHPLFKRERTRFFYNHFNSQNKTIEEVEIIFRQIDLMSNAINEKTGNHIAAEELYLMVISAINDYHYPLQEVNTEELYAEMENLVFTYTPVLYCGETLRTLQKLKQKASESTFSLLSNTAFIKGSTLRTVLNKMELSNYFDFQLYSDETGMSKPNVQLFQLMIDTIPQKKDESLHLTEIVHIGDNEKADGWGADRAGINSVIINSNHQTILSLLN